MAQKALLLAIADYTRLRKLPFTATDAQKLAEALKCQGVKDDDIVIPGAGGDGGFLSATELRSQLQEFFDAASGDDDLLVYFSGHGAEQDGHRLLIPQDYNPERPSRLQELPNYCELLTSAMGCKAGSVLFVIDACREKITLKLDAKASGWPAQQEPPADAPSLAFVYSCDAGQFSGADKVDGTMSAFTRAFVQALTCEGQGGALADVLRDVQAALPKFAGPDQTLCQPTIPFNGGRRGHPLQLIIRTDAQSQRRARMDADPWVQGLRKNGEWLRLQQQDPGLADAVTEIAFKASEEAKQDQAAAGWRANDPPLRVLTILDQHLALSCRKPAEIAVTLAVPFVYEAALAAASRLLVQPDSLPAKAWAVADGEDEVGRSRFARLQALNKQDDAAAFATWRRIRFLHHSGMVWATDEKSGWVWGRVKEIAPAGYHVLAPWRLLRLAGLMFAEFDDVAQEETHGDLRQGAFAGECDPYLAAHRLNLAGRLALDLRRLPPVMAEHIGCDPAAGLAVAVNAMATATWLDVGGGGAKNLTLTLTDCPHQALDAALREAVDMADAYRRRLCAEAGKYAALSGILPSTFTANKLAPALTNTGKPLYDPHHLRFTLDQGRVMRLLMGEQLYGDPNFALRELYQNALDACRYRRAEEQCRAKEQGRDLTSTGYVGRITFRFGEDGGRRFIECEDNGVGMAPRHLRRLFAKAGQRFADSHEYHRDKARWDSAGVQFWPNSRFGIGVLSYFMLAEEVEVVSRRLSPASGGAETPTHARVLSGGALFRLSPPDAQPFMPTEGSRVRLYLDPAHAKPLEDYRQSILEWLWLPEFDVRLELPGADLITLEANKPTPTFEDKCGQLLPMRGGEDFAGNPRLFWCLKAMPVTDRGRDLPSAVLVDGVKTSYYDGFQREHAEKHISGTTINLTADWRASLSVNRAELMDCDEINARVLDHCRRADWRDFIDWRQPSTGTALAIMAIAPATISALTEALRGGSVNPLSFGLWREDQRSAPLIWRFPDVCDIDYWIAVAAGRDKPRRDVFTCRLLAARLVAGRPGPAAPPAWRRLAAFMRPWKDVCHPSLLLSLIAGGDYRHARNIRRLDVGDLLAFAYRHQFPLAQVAALVERLAPLGVAIPDLSGWKDEFSLTADHVRLLSYDLDGSAPWIDRLTAFWQCRAAWVMGRPLSEIADLARPLAALGVEVEKPTPRHAEFILEDIHCEVMDDGYGTLRPALSSANLLEAAGRTDAPMAKIVAAARQLGDLGMRIPDLSGWNDGMAIPERARSVLATHWIQPIHYLNQLFPIRLLYAAQRWGVGIDAVMDEIRPLAALGYSIPKIDSSLSVPTFDGTVEKMLGLGGHQENHWMSLQFLATTSHSIGRSLADSLRILKPFIAFYPALQAALDKAGWDVDEDAATIIRQLYATSDDDDVIDYELSIWDFADAAQALNFDAARLRPALDWLEKFGVENIPECREFVDFCEQNPAVDDPLTDAPAMGGEAMIAETADA